MTYEKFTKEVTTRDSKLTRKDVAKFTVKFLATYCMFVFVFLYLCMCTLPHTFIPLIGILFAFLFVFLYDYMAENEELFNKMQKLVTKWWAFLILAVLLYILITLLCT